MRYTEDDVTRQLVDWIRNEADLDDLAAMYSEHTASKDDPVVVVVRGPSGPESDPYMNGKYVDGLIAAAPELLAALKAAVAMIESEYAGFDAVPEWQQAQSAIAKAEGKDN